MLWITERIKTVTQAFGPSWVRMVALAAAFLGGTFSLARDWLASKSIVFLPTLPTWSFWAGGTAILMFWWLLEYATTLRKSLTPRLKLSFSPSTCIVRTDAQSEKSAFSGSLTFIKATYVRVAVENFSSTNANGVAAFLKSAVRHADQKEAILHDALPLTWVHSTMTEATLLPGLIKHVDVLRQKALTGGGFEVCTPSEPFSLIGFFDDPGTYSFVVLVNLNGVNEEIRFEIERPVNWDGTTGKIIITKRST